MKNKKNYTFQISPKRSLPDYFHEDIIQVVIYVWFEFLVLDFRLFALTWCYDFNFKILLKFNPKCKHTKVAEVSQHLGTNRLSRCTDLTTDQMSIDKKEKTTNQMHQSSGILIIMNRKGIYNGHTGNSQFCCWVWFE